MNTPPDKASRSSLDRRLPLMISALLAITIAAFGMIAYREVYSSGQAAATTQLRTLLTQAAENASRAFASRVDGLARAADSKAIVAVIQNPNSAEAQNDARTFQLMRRSAVDSQTLVAEVLIGTDGNLLPFQSDTITGIRRAALDSAVRVSRVKDSTVVTDFYPIGQDVRYWVVTPVHSGKTIIGNSAEERRVRNTQGLNEQINAVTGQKFSLLVTTKSGRLWSSTNGPLLTAPFDIRAERDTFRLRGADGERFMGAKAPVRGSPWVLVLTARDADVNVRADSFLRRMLWIGAILLIIGAVASRVVSRRVTGPLQSLTAATRNLAQGDFTARHDGRSNDELGELATAFNGMAEQIGQSHDLLARRMRESEQLAAQLQDRNDELRVAEQVAMEARETSEFARAEAQRHNTAKSEFVAMMSHELRTPLSAIAGYAEILQLGLRGELNDAMRSDITRIQANQAHLLRIINDILDLAQVESGQLAVTLSPVPLRAVFADLEPIVSPAISAKELEWRVELKDDELCALADRERLIQVLVNLVANATRFTESGGQVMIRAESHHGRLQIHVIDNGVGIAPALQQRIFEPFMQAEGGSARRAQGTGLGLTISRRLVEAMSGTLTLNSEPGIGSTFTIELALAERTPANSRPAPSTVSTSNV